MRLIRRAQLSLDAGTSVRSDQSRTLRMRILGRSASGHDQNFKWRAAWLPCGLSLNQARRRGRLSLCVLAARQAHREHRALARLARHRHIAAHHAGKLAREGKAEPRAAEALRGGGIGLAELLEQLRLLLRS